MIRYRCLGIFHGKECRDTYGEKVFCLRCGNKPNSKDWEQLRIPEDLLPEEQKILENPELLNLIYHELGKRAVGESKAKLNLILFCMGRLVTNSHATSFNGIPHEKSGTGKDHLTKCVTQLCVPEEDLCHRTRISPAVLNYWHQNERGWTWNGKVLFLEDVSESILNAEVTKTFLSGGSTCTVLIKQIPVDIKIHGKPVCLFTTANSTPAEETLRRIQLVPLDGSREQTQRIKEFQANIAMNGKAEEYDKLLQNALGKLREHSVVIPFADWIVSEFPNELIARTAINRFLDYIRASTILHQHQRQYDKKGNLIPTDVDYDVARMAFMHCLSVSGNMVPLTVNQKKVLSAIKETQPLVEGKSSPTLVSKFLTKTGLPKSTVYRQLDGLVSAGILLQEEGTDDYNHRATLYSVASSSVFELPTFSELVKKHKTDENNETDRTNRTDKTNPENA